MRGYRFIWENIWDLIAKTIIIVMVAALALGFIYSTFILASGLLHTVQNTPVVEPTPWTIFGHLSTIEAKIDIVLTQTAPTPIATKGH